MATPFRTAYDGVVFSGMSFKVDEGLTQQCFKKECDINHILAQYQKTGLVHHVNTYQGRYDDVTGDVDFQTALNTLKSAEDCFMSLPSGIRKRFDNNPAEFLSFVTNPDNADEVVELGLGVTRPAEPAASPPVPPDEGAAAG